MSPDWSMPFSPNTFDPFILPGMKASGLSPSRVRAPSEGAAKSTRVAKTAEQKVALPSGEDDATLRQCLAGIGTQDQVALCRLYDLTVSRVYGIALRIVRHADLAEEVISDVYMQVWRDSHRYDDSRGKVIAWLLIITRSRALDLLRRQDEAFSHPEPYELVSEPASNHDNPEDLLNAAQAGSALHDAMKRLTPLQRQLLSLAFFRGLSHTEIVDSTGIPLGSVKTHIRRALGALRDRLGPDAGLAQ